MVAKGVEDLTKYNLSWQFVNGAAYTQDNPPEDAHTGDEMTTLGDPINVDSAYTWKKKSEPDGTFKAEDAGWYRLT
ncbi:MAG: hypothetical protein RR614_08465, partial [Eubacterium sp.]